MPRIRLYANLRDLAGTSELTAPGRTVRTVLEEIMKAAPSLQGILLGGGELGSQVVLVLNGRNVTDLDTAIGEDEVLAMFPPIAGG